MYDNAQWLARHYFRRDIHTQCQRWLEENRNALAGQGISVDAVDCSAPAEGEGCCAAQFSTARLLASLEVRERGFIDVAVLDIESGAQVVSMHLEWQTSVDSAIKLLVEFLAKNGVA